MTLENVAPIEAVWIIGGLVVLLVIISNCADVLADWLLVRLREIQGMVRQAAKDNLRRELGRMLKELALLTVGFGAASAPSRPDTRYAWVSLLSATALMTIHVIIGVESVMDKASRKAMLKLYIQPGDTLATTIEKAKQQKRRADDAPLANLVNVADPTTAEVIDEARGDAG